MRLGRLVSLWVLGAMAACSGGEAPRDMGMVIQIAVSPTTATLNPGQTQTFLATVTGSSDTAVSWSVEEVGGGSIGADGLYTAPTAIGMYHVRAAAHADPTITASATVTVTMTKQVGITITPMIATVGVNGSQTFSATVTNAQDTSVTFAVTESEGGTITTAGVYTAPSTVGTYHVTATSVADPGKTATATVTVRPNVSVTPATATLNGGQKQTFAAVVDGASDQSVTWSVMEGASGGSVTADGTYTAPSTNGTYHVVATSVADNTRSATATITVTSTPQVYVTLAPDTITLDEGEQTTFTPTVTGSGDTAVSYTVQEGSSGGSVTSGGVYTAPFKAGTYHVIATSHADTTKTAVAVVTVRDVSIMLTESSVNLLQGEPHTFVATVTGTVNSAVTFMATGGSFVGAGYTAPISAGDFTITATSVADGTKTATATVHTPALTIAISGPASVPLDQGEQHDFDATVTGAYDGTYTWSVDKGASIASDGGFIAPPLNQTYTITATSNADLAKTATVSVPVPDIVVTMAPGNVTLAPGQTRPFTATVTGTVIKGVSYSMQGGGAGGTVNAIGVYYAPGTTGTDHVVATADANGNKKATSTVTLTNTIAVAVSPATATLNQGQKQSFAAIVTGTANSAVTWSVTGGGFISQLGVYTAPNSNTTATITATSQADGTTIGTATVMVSNAVAQIAVAVSPQSASIAAAGTKQLSATVTGTANTAVTWSVLEPGGGTVDATGLYTAPGGAGTYHVVATSVADASKSALATMTVSTGPPVTVSVSPTVATLAPSQTKAFTATVSGSTHGVIWSVVGGPPNGAVDAFGNYTAPATPGTYLLVATAMDDASATATASIDVTNTIGVTVSPGSTTIAAGSTQQFTAVVTGTVNQAVTWSILGSPAGYSIDSSGLLSTPASVGSPTTITIEATSVVGAVIGSADVTVQSSSLHTVSGTISWAGPVPHRIFVSVFDPLDFNNYPLAGTSIAAPGPYVIHGVRKPNSNKLVVLAWADHGNMKRSGTDPQGTTAQLAFDGTADLAGADVTLADPPVTLASGIHPELNMVLAADGGFGAGFSHVYNNNNDDVADHYNVYVSTQPSPGPQNQLFMRSVDSAIETTAFFQIPNGTTVYVGVSAVNSSGEGPLTTAGPYLIGPTTPPGATVTGFVDLASLPRTGQLDAFARCANNSIVGTIVTGLSPITPFSITRVPNGVCRFHVTYDHDRDGVIGPFDPEVMPSRMATIAGDTGLSTMFMPISASRFFVAFNRFFDEAGVLQTEHMHFVVRPVSKMPVKATLLTGPGYAGMLPIDMPVGEHYGGSIELALRDLIPSGTTILEGDTYTALITYDDGTSEILSAQVTGVLQPPTNLQVTAGTTPTFTWNDPISPPAFVDYRMNVVVANNERWFAESLSSPTLYNFDGSGQALSAGVPTEVHLELRDGYENSVEIYKGFTP